VNYGSSFFKGFIKTSNSLKAFLMGELAAAKRSLAKKYEEMRQMEERLQRLESAHGSHEIGG